MASCVPEGPPLSVAITDFGGQVCGDTSAVPCCGVHIALRTRTIQSGAMSPRPTHMHSLRGGGRERGGAHHLAVLVRQWPSTMSDGGEPFACLVCMSVQYLIAMPLACWTCMDVLMCACAQDVYQRSHPILFCDRAVYVVVFSHRSVHAATLERDLEHHLLGVTARFHPAPPILVVGTHVDGLAAGYAAPSLASLKTRFPSVA